MDNNPYAPPRASVEGPISSEPDAPALWNPNAAASWCLLFTPVFGAWLHMKNWEALGDKARAASGRTWLYAAIAIQVAIMVVSLAFPRLPGMRIVGFAFLIGWYYAAGKPQARYVLGRFGTDYPRRGWLAPLGWAFLALAIWIAIVFAAVFNGLA